MAAKKKETKKPGWKQHQQKRTGSNKKSAVPKAKAKSGFVKLKMKTGYRHFAKPGDIWETTEVKAKELVALGRAEYYDKKKHGAE